MNEKKERERKKMIETKLSINEILYLDSSSSPFFSLLLFFFSKNAIIHGSLLGNKETQKKRENLDLYDTNY